MTPKIAAALDRLDLSESFMERTENKLNHVLAEIADLFSIANDEAQQAYEGGEISLSDSEWLYYRVGEALKEEISGAA